MNVEKAGIEDIDSLVQLRLAYLTEDFGSLTDEESAAIRKELPAYFRDHLGRDLFVYVIRSAGAIIACAFLLVIEKPISPAFLNGKTGTVLNVYTHPNHRRRGLAGEIMEALITDAEEMDLSVIELKSTEDGYSLYQKAGFEDDHSHYRFMKWKNPRKH